MVLLVDDEADAREVIATVLEDAEYEVLQAANGMEALATLAAHEGKCDVILLDLLMPVMNGWTFRKKQKEDPALAGIPVVLMSAGARIALARGDLDAAASVTKPVDIPELLERVSECCR